MTLKQRPVKPFRNRVRELRWVRAGSLHPNPANWRRHPEAQSAVLRGVLEEIGWADALIAYETPDGLTLVDGHLRAGLEPDQQVPVLVLDLDAAEAVKLLAVLDPLASMAQPDQAALLAVLREADYQSQAVKDMLGALANGSFQPLMTPQNGEHSNGLTDPDDAPLLPTECYVRRGDIWQLGDHRVMCGDSRDPKDVEGLLRGKLVAMVMADPPYNVNYTGGSSNRRKRKDLYPDHLSQADYQQWLRDILLLAHSSSDQHAALHLWFGDPLLEQVLAALREAGWSSRALIIWNKLGAHYGALGRQYKMAFEPLIYGFKSNASPRWYGSSDERSVWDYPQPSRNELHPTMKPVALYERSLSNHSKQGDPISELFLGSGTTIIACERLGRVCYAMEIDPRYVQVAIERWQNYTGQKAAKVS